LVRVAIAGAGNVGSYIAADLKADHEVLLVEQDPDIADRVRAALDVTVVEGDACEPVLLEELGLEQFDVVVAATGDDEDNLVISLLAKQEFAVPRVVARVNHPQNQWLFNESWGVDISVSTPHLLTALVEEAVAVGSLVRLMQFGDAGLVEVTLAEESPAVGKAIAELGVPRDATIVAVIRGERHVVVPRGETVMETGDEVLVLVTPESEEPVKALLVGSRAARSTGEPPSAAADGESSPP
jgi:trk system potassium uptake protein TrkA